MGDEGEQNNTQTTQHTTTQGARPWGAYRSPYAAGWGGYGAGMGRYGGYGMGMGGYGGYGMGMGGYGGYGMGMGMGWRGGLAVPGETVAETLRRSKELQATAGQSGLVGYPGVYGAGWGMGAGRAGWGGYGSGWGMGAGRAGWGNPWWRRQQLAQQQTQGEEETTEEQTQEPVEQTQLQSTLALAQDTLRRSRELRGWGGYPGVQGAGWGMGYPGVYGAGWGMGAGRVGWGGYGAALRRSRLLAQQTMTTNAPLTTSTSVNDTLNMARDALKRSQMGLQHHVHGLPQQQEEEQTQEEEEQVQEQPEQVAEEQPQEE